MSSWPASTLSPMRTATASTLPVPGKLTSMAPEPATRPSALNVSSMDPRLTIAWFGPRAGAFAEVLAGPFGLVDAESRALELDVSAPRSTEESEPEPVSRGTIDAGLSCAQAVVERPINAAPTTNLQDLTRTCMDRVLRRIGVTLRSVC